MFGTFSFTRRSEYHHFLYAVFRSTSRLNSLSSVNYRSNLTSKDGIQCCDCGTSGGVQDTRLTMPVQDR